MISYAVPSFAFMDIKQIVIREYPFFRAEARIALVKIGYMHLTVKIHFQILSIYIAGMI